MAKTKIKKSSVGVVKPLTKKQEGFLSQIKWGESYTSLFLGAVVVLVALVLVFSFFKSRNAQINSTSDINLTNETLLPQSYVVKEGDNLWSIAEKIYGSGYNWVDLAKANKLENPSVLYVGTKLSVPNVKVKEQTIVKQSAEGKNPITQTSYKVVKGDYLWDIAVRAYGDGYKWVEIAKANKLVNPNLIHSGNVLKLPR
ncbi:MAG: LysM peptidoglycan-binding domain-containing protein [Actinobacteria bacterium]|nr:LysM peptidoglycan-binding domain-containing protein [Actinomycetota bacterium]